MRRLLQWYREWRTAAYERARMTRVEEELRIKRELDYVHNSLPDSKRITMSQLTAPSLMSQSINDPNRRC